jgi:dTDP-4-amino-4,6-dideoxygalactose transaminase
MSIFKERGFNISYFPVAYDLYSREISLPVYPELNQHKVEYIVNAVAAAYESIP